MLSWFLKIKMKKTQWWPLNMGNVVGQLETFKQTNCCNCNNLLQSCCFLFVTNCVVKKLVSSLFIFWCSPKNGTSAAFCRSDHIGTEIWIRAPQRVKVPSWAMGIEKYGRINKIYDYFFLLAPTQNVVTSITRSCLNACTSALCKQHRMETWQQEHTPENQICLLCK